MSSTGDILRKKLRPRRVAQGVSLAWWVAEADRLMRDLFKTSFDVDVALADVGGTQMAASDALDAMAPVTLPFLLDTGRGGRGLFTIDGALIDALIELQMLGKVMGMARLDRPITAIDAGLSEVFVRASLEALNAGPAGVSGLTTLGPQQDRAALRLALGEGRYDVLRAQIDLGPGIKTGVCTIWLPAEVARPVVAPAKPASGAMKAVLDRCKVDLMAQVDGVEVSALALARLTQGSVLPLPASAISDVALRDCTGAQFASARLGRLHGARAVRITQMQGGRVADGPPGPAQVAFQDTDLKAEGLAGPEVAALDGQVAVAAQGDEVPVPVPVPKAG